MGIEELLPKFSQDGCQVPPSRKWPLATEQLLRGVNTRHLLLLALGQLPDVYRTVFWLRDIEGLDAVATAQLLELNVALVKTRVHRARQALAGLLDPHFAGGAS